jgi:hypothetical protein
MGICTDPAPTPSSHSGVRSVIRQTEEGRREMMSKAMGQATGGRNLRVTMAMAALAAVLLALTLVAVFQTASTSSDSVANPAMSAEGKGVPRSVNLDPAIDRHAEVVQHLGNGSLR